MRPARLAIAAVAAALAAGLVQAPALAETPVPTAPAAGNVVLDEETGEPTQPPVDSAVPAPVDLSYVLGPDSATISFTAPATAKTITNYQWSDQGGVWVDFVPAVTTSPVTIPGIKPGQPYSVALRAVTADGVGAASIPVDFKIEPPAPPKRNVIFSVGDQLLAKPSGSKVITLKPGTVLKMRNVPEGSTIAVVDKKDAQFTLGVRETSKARTWVTDTLPPARRLWVTVTEADGRVAGRTNFKMDRAENSFTVNVWPKSNDMGAGVPLVVDFGIPITNKAEVERALIVTSDKDFGEAGWFWVDSKKAVFRPRDYWPGNATITLNANLSSIEGAKGVWGPRVQSTFKTGDQVILKVNLNKHRMTYTRNGKLEQTFPISGGKSGWETESGTKVITAKLTPKRLYNPDPEEGWDVTVDYGIRVNDNGEYIHDAPWNYSIGYANTSHGCTNMTPSDMAWIWRNTKFGDVAEYTGTSNKIGTDDYLAGYWNYTWPEWKRGSALWQDQ